MIKSKVQYNQTVVQNIEIYNPLKIVAKYFIPIVKALFIEEISLIDK